MSPPNSIAMALMPASQAAAWYALLASGRGSNPTKQLYMTLSATAAFYCAWALFKYFIEGETRERGHISMGLAATTTLLQMKYPSAATLGIVILNFALPFALTVTMPAAKLAKLVKDTDSTEGLIWAWIFKAYLLSNLFFWGLSVYKVWLIPSDDTGGKQSYSEVEQRDAGASE